MTTDTGTTYRCRKAASYVAIRKRYGWLLVIVECFASALFHNCVGIHLPAGGKPRPAHHAPRSSRMTDKADDTLELVPNSHGGDNSNSSSESSNMLAISMQRTDATLDMNIEKSTDQALQDGNQGTASGEVDDIDYDPEVILLTKFRLALGSTLRMLECARDDLVRLGERMDRLTVASRQCRERLEAQQEVERHRDESRGVENSDLCN